MPNFRAKNQLSESPLKPTPAVRQLPDIVSRPKGEMRQARPSVVVPALDKPSEDQPRQKSDIRQAVTKATKALEKPRKKKRSSASTSKPRRQQAVRENKLVPSIEYSPRKPTGSPERDNDGAGDSEFVPSEADLTGISMSLASNTPSRRSPRKHPSKYRDTKLSPQASSAHAAIRRESSPPMAPGISARPTSPSLWSSPLRQKRYEQHEFVELPKKVFDRIDRSERSERIERKHRKKQKRIEKEAMMAEKRKDKGKAAEQRPIEETHRSRQKRDKRKAQGQMEQNEPRKRRKAEKSEKPRPEDPAYNGRVPSEGLQSSKQRSEGETTEEQAQRYRPVLIKAEDRLDINDSLSKTGIEARSEGSKNKKVQPSSQASAKTQHFPLHDEQLDKPGEQASRNRGRQERPPKQDCRESLKRREVSVPEGFRPCTCSELPAYFTEDPRYVPRLETWPRRASQFYEHVKQISNCRGTIHPRHVVNACYWILKASGYPERCEENFVQSTDEVAQGVSSTSGRSDSDPRRAQSSISPPVFYGKRSGCRPDASTGSSLRSGLRPLQDGGTEGTQSKTLPVRNQDRTARTHDAPLVSQPSKSAELNQTCNYLTAPSGQENVGARQTSKTLLGASSVYDRPQRSFDAQRRRHQSAPVHVVGRNSAVGERDRLLQSAPQQHDVLHEISNNAIFKRMNQRMDEFQKAILERLPATAPTQIAAAGPVSAPAPNTAAAAQGENGADGRPASSSERTRPSRAIRPRLDRNVPAHLRLTDEAIIEVGRIVTPYERHVGAPQAFDQRGRLFADYKRLLSRTADDGGGLVWTPDEIRRLTR